MDEGSVVFTMRLPSMIVGAAFDPSPDGAVIAVAREHFGFLTPVVAHASPAAALEAVRTGAATVAVLPFPVGPSAWWSDLTARDPRLHVIARLPFWIARPDHVPHADTLVVGPTAPDASGADRSFIAFADHARLADAGLIVRATHGPIVEVDGMIAEDDPRLTTGVIVHGGYAIPVPGDPV